MVLPDGVELVVRVVGGKVQVAGPVGEKLICYALLEAAKDAVRDYVASQAGLIVPADITQLPKG